MTQESIRPEIAEAVKRIQDVVKNGASYESDYITQQIGDLTILTPKNTKKYDQADDAMYLMENKTYGENVLSLPSRMEIDEALEALYFMVKRYVVGYSDTQADKIRSVLQKMRGCVCDGKKLR